MNPSVLLDVGLIGPLALGSPTDQEFGHPFVSLTDQEPDLVLVNLTVHVEPDHPLINLAGQAGPVPALRCLSDQEVPGLALVNLSALDAAAVHPVGLVACRV